MTGAVAIRSFGAEFQPFLYALIGDEKSGMQLSVLSALARQNIDPWEQATCWSRLPEHTATQELASLISALPEGLSARPEPETIAARLIALLPTRPSSVAAGPESPSKHELAHRVGAQKIRMILLFMLLMLLGHWILVQFEPPARTETVETPSASGAPTQGSAPSAER